MSYVVNQPLPTLLTQLSGVAGQTDAGEGPGSIQAGGAVQTRVGLAFIHLCKHHTLALIPHQPGGLWLLCMWTCMGYLSHSVAR